MLSSPLGRWRTWETKVMPLERANLSKCDSVLWTVHSTAWESSPSFPCPCSWSQCQFSQRIQASLEAAVWAFSGGVFECFSQQAISWGCFKWTSLHSVCVCRGGCNKEGMTLKFATKSLCVSCHHGEKPASQLGRGPRETRKTKRVRLKEISLIMQRGHWHQGSICSTKYEVSPKQHCELASWCVLPQKGPFYGKNN